MAFNFNDSLRLAFIPPSGVNSEVNQIAAVSTGAPGTDVIGALTNAKKSQISTLILKGHPLNTGIIYISFGSVTNATTTGFPLGAGDVMTINYNPTQVGDGQFTIRALGSAASQILAIVAVVPTG